MSTYVGSKLVALSQEQTETSLWVYQQNHKYFFLIKTLDCTRVKQKGGHFDITILNIEFKLLLLPTKHYLWLSRFNNIKHIIENR